MKKLKHVKLFENFNSNDFKQLLGKSIRRIDWQNDATDYEDGIMIINTDDGMYELSGVTGGEFYFPQVETYGSISAPERRYMHLDEYNSRLMDLADFKDINRNYPGHKITTVESLNDIKPYVQSNPFQCDLSDIIRSNISSHLKKQPLEQIELIKMIKANSLLSQIDSVIIIEELDKMVVDHYIKIDNGKYYKVIY